MCAAAGESTSLEKSFGLERDKNRNRKLDHSLPPLPAALPAKLAGLPAPSTETDGEESTKFRAEKGQDLRRTQSGPVGGSDAELQGRERETGHCPFRAHEVKEHQRLHF